MMDMYSTPFRDRAKKLLTQVIKQRLFLIETRKSLNFVTWDQCNGELTKLEPLRSDRQFAQYLKENGDLMLHMAPTRNALAKRQINWLIHEANEILKNYDESRRCN